MSSAADPQNELSPTHKLKADAAAVGAAAVGAVAVGAFALGALAVGALAIGAVSVGALSIGAGRVRKLVIDELRVGRWEVEARD